MTPRPRTTIVEVPFTQQIDVAASVAPLGRWGDDLLDRFDGRTLVRTISLASDSATLPYALTVPARPTNTLSARLPAGAPDDAGVAIAATFVTDAEALAELAGRDAAIAELVARYPGVVPVLIPDPFHALVRSISAQQINLRFAAVIRQRLAMGYGQRLEVGDDHVYVLDREVLASASVEELRALQLTFAKACAVVATTRAAVAGELRRTDVEALTDDEVITHLTRLPGIGRWSAEWFLARTLGRPRVVAGDLGVRKAVGRMYGVGMPSEDDTRRLTEHWGTAATVAQALALHDLAISPSVTPAR